MSTYSAMFVMKKVNVPVPWAGGLQDKGKNSLKKAERQEKNKMLKSECGGYQQVQTWEHAQSSSSDVKSYPPSE